MKTLAFFPNGAKSMITDKQPVAASSNKQPVLRKLRHCHCTEGMRVGHRFYPIGHNLRVLQPTDRSIDRERSDDQSRKWLDPAPALSDCGWPSGWSLDIRCLVCCSDYQSTENWYAIGKVTTNLYSRKRSACSCYSPVAMPRHRVMHRLIHSMESIWP